MSIAKKLQQQLSTAVITTALSASLVLVGMNAALAGPREQAKRIHDRIAGVPPSESTLNAMVAVMPDIDAAVDIAMQNKNFYNVTLKNMITPWTNEERSVFEPLNDYTATVIGIVRDDETDNSFDFRAILSGDLLYIAGSGAPSTVTAGYSSSNNTMYEQLEDSFADLGDPTVLTQTTQSGTYSGDSSLPPEATAGVITTRQGARAFFYAGTNRAMFRFTMLNHLCHDLESVKDITRPNDHIRQDVTRSPGGDSSIFMTNCIGCHAGMDGMAGAFAYYDWIYTDEDGSNGHLVYYEANEALNNLVFINTDDPAERVTSRVSQKHLINYNNFIYGHITRNNNWVNYWRNGVNDIVLGWSDTLPAGVTLDEKGNSRGAGAKQLGQELANSRAFAECQVSKVYRTVCHGEPDNTELNSMTTNFMSSYNLKDVFREAMGYCVGP